MKQRTLLAAAIAAIGTSGISSVQATPFMPMDARGLAMGNTGVASAKRAHAPAYNPSLLSKAQDDDDFAIIFPQVGVMVADEDEMIDTAQDINDYIVPELEALFDDNGSNFESAVDDVTAAADALEAALDSQNEASIQSANNNFGTALDELESQLDSLNNTVGDLDAALNTISGSPLSGRVGVATAIAIPSKKFAAALSLNSNISFSGRMIYSGNDSNLMLAYGDAASGYVDAAKDLQSGVDAALAETDTQNKLDAYTALETTASDLQSYNSAEVETASGTIRIIENGATTTEAEDGDMDSQLQVLGVAISEVGLSFSREFEIYGQPIAFGITPKMQQVTTFHYVTELDNEDSEISDSDFEDATEEATAFNLDIGASWSIGDSGKWVVGLVGKNLLGGTFETADAEIRGAATTSTVEGQDIKLNPQFRTGVAYNGEWTSVAIDVDLTENEAVAYEDPTQFASIGAEFDIFSTLQLRAGYRSNLAGTDADVASIGFGFSPFGVHLDVAAMANPSKPEKEAGIAAEFGFYF